MSIEVGVPFREKPDMAQVFIRQLDRTNQAAALALEIHQACVYQLLANLPGVWRQWVYDQRDTWEVTGPTLMYKKFCGRRIGSQNNPLLRDPEKPVRRLEDGGIDWSDPNIVSPVLQEHTEVDIRRFNELVMEAAEHSKLTWSLEEREHLIGDLRKMKRRKTPYRIPREEKEEESSEETEP